MDVAFADSHTAAAQPVFTDGFGERRCIVDAHGDGLDVLKLSSVFSAASSVEFAIRERASRIAKFQHDGFSRIRTVELDKPSGALLIISDHERGERLSTLLAATEKAGIPIDPGAVRGLIRQLVSAMAVWHEEMPDVAHGAIAPERIVVDPTGRLVVVDGVFGSALEQLRYSREQYWNTLGVFLPASGNTPSIDVRTDVTQIGLVVLALILGRRIVSTDPASILSALDSCLIGSGVRAPVSPSLHDWVLRALQFDPKWSFATAIDAYIALDTTGKEHAEADRDAIRQFVARCVAPLGSAAPESLPDVAAAIPLQAAPPMTAPATAVPGGDPLPDADLGERIEALRAFLARHPPRPEDLPLEALPPAPAPPSAGAEESRPARRPAVVVAPAPPTTPAPAAPKSRGEGLRDSHSTPEFAALEPPLLIGQNPTPKSAAPLQINMNRRLWIGGAVLAGAALLIAMVVFGFPRFGSSASTGTLTIVTSPGPAGVVVDGEPRGVTPVTLELSPGQHLVELTTSAGVRRVPVTIEAGRQASQYLELPQTTETGVGQLQVRTDPPAASVTVDGRFIGRSPVSVPDLSPGAHTVVLQGPSGAVTQQVLIEPGRTASLMVPMAATSIPRASAGWISVAAPADVQIFEGGRLLGTNGIDRIMVPVGRHDIEIVNEPLGYRERRTLQVTAGQVTAVRVTWPMGTLALNAVPWAEVFVDGQSVGETPIGGVQVPVGTHEVVFRHPELGERKASVTVIAGQPAKVGVDLRAR